MPRLFGVGIIPPAPIVAMITMTGGNTIAVLGGAFDPIHDGHLHLARRALRELPAAQVRLIPNGAPPHKPQPAADWHWRMLQCQRATAGDKRIIVGDDEPPGKKRRTINTIRKLRQKSPLILIVGADAFWHFRRWREWRGILRVASIAVARRRGCPMPIRAVPPRWTAKVVKPGKLWRGVYFWRTNAPAPRISSTTLRARAAGGGKGGKATKGNKGRAGR